MVQIGQQWTKSSMKSQYDDAQKETDNLDRIKETEESK